MHIIRNLEKDDAEDVALLIPQLTQNITDQENLVERIEQLVKPKNSQFLVAEADGKVVGLGGIAWYSIPSKGEIAWVEEVVVDEKYRGQGIAKALIGELLKIAEQKHIKTIKLTSANSAANSLYEKFGFIKKDHQYFVKKVL